MNQTSRMQQSLPTRVARTSANEPSLATGAPRRPRRPAGCASTEVRIAQSGQRRRGAHNGGTLEAAPAPGQCEMIGSGDTRARAALGRRFASRLVVRRDLNRRLVSYQANKAQPGLRWFKYKEGFSAALARDALRLGEGPVLDPFAGLGTSVLVAGGAGRDATGIEIMAVGARAAQAIARMGNGVDAGALRRAGARLLGALDGKQAAAEHRFPHVRITEKAFPSEAEDAIAKARGHLARMRDDQLRALLDFACMSVLEEVSYTRKDGQYLRWDGRCGRSLRGAMHKGPIPSFPDALARRIGQMTTDAAALRRDYGGRLPRIVHGSALTELPRLADASVGLTITSPPYANRYDYTRTYALELAWLGHDQAAFASLRQALISATVENRSKQDWLEREYARPAVLAQAKRAVAEQAALREVLDALRSRRAELSNPHVIRLVENYFAEMAVVIAELARVTRPGGRVMMVNDNVQYNGEEVPVDLILSDIAETCGFVCEEIGVLPHGKGNASQQMGRFGRRELRKCVYRWKRRGANG